MGLVPRYDVETLRRAVVEIGARVGLPRRLGLLLARRMLWNEWMGQPAEGLASLPELLDRLGGGVVDPHAEPWISSLPDGSGAGLHAGGTLPHLALARAAEAAAQLARTRPGDPGAAVRIWGIDEPISPAAEVADLAVGPFVAAGIGRDGHRVAAWPTDLGLPLLYDPRRDPAAADGQGEAGRDLPPTPPVERSRPDEIVIAARGVDPVKELRAFRERMTPFLEPEGRSESSGLLHPELWRRRREQASSQGLTLPAGLVADLVARSERFGLPPLRPIDDPGDRLSW